MGYVIFRGVSTQSLENVYVAKMPSHKKASMRYTEYYVKGRDGALHVDEGFANFDLTVSLVLLKANANTRQLVNAWADGTGMLITSDDLSKAYRATVKEEITWTRVSANGGFYDTAEIIFNCEPCMYEAQYASYEFTSNGNIVFYGTADAYPLIKVEGSGDTTFSVAGESITIKSMASGVPVYIDCENGYVYTESGATTMTGDFPVLKVGAVSYPVTLGTGASKITITPHWRWV